MLHVAKLEKQNHLSLVDTEHGVARFAVCPAKVWSCFDPGFSHDSSVVLLAKVMCILFPCMMEVGNLQGATVKRLLQS